MKSHQQQQPSTSGQCGTTFNRPDNLAKHLRHCTDHRQLPPPPQQQTAAPPPPTTTTTFTIPHQYSSMGGAVERYIINYLSTALHLLLPSMKTFRTKHHAYKFQIAIMIVGQKAVGPSVVTQPPITNTAPPVDDGSRQLLNFIEVFELNGSGSVFSNFQSLQLIL